MLRLFRKLRGNTLNAGNSKLYLLYAVGELFLVVAGILIALQINNWNELRKTELLEFQFLENLHEDLVADTLYYNLRIEHAEYTIEDFYRFIHQAYHKQNSFDEYREILPSDWPSQNLILETPTYEELKNTGMMDIFQNKRIKNLIISLYQDYERAAAHISDMNDLTRVEFYKFTGVVAKPVFTDIFDQEHMFDNLDWEYINDPHSELFKQVESTAMLYSFKHRVFRDHCENLHARTSLLINQIKEELVDRQ